ncbi:hypothetical protein SAY86_009116 [Trapa natans]|uniref:Uncharacterized protein n=1 Tax=Trapa natans TaxID=22666 RepID=A0AAN7K7K0_TRANT|nr:hypothetical protein SAY86_009116 [Trapa natans]
MGASLLQKLWILSCYIRSFSKPIHHSCTSHGSDIAGICHQDHPDKDENCNCKREIPERWCYLCLGGVFGSCALENKGGVGGGGGPPTKYNLQGGDLGMKFQRWC